MGDLLSPLLLSHLLSSFQNFVANVSSFIFSLPFNSALKKTVDACYKSTIFCQEALLLIFFYIVRLFLFRERESMRAGGDAEGEADSLLSAEHNMGLYPRTLRS